jgi:Protein of unknown function (DUF433)
MKGKKYVLARSNQHRSEDSRRQTRHQGNADRRRFPHGTARHGWTHEQILKNYPHLSEDEIQAALHYASETAKQEHVNPLPV